MCPALPQASVDAGQLAPAAIRLQQRGRLRDTRARLAEAEAAITPADAESTRLAMLRDQADMAARAARSDRAPLEQTLAKAVEAGGKEIGKLAVASLMSPTKVDGGFFTGGASGPAKDTAVRQGFLEQPNATAAETMVDMIESLRAFEADQRVIHSIDESLQRGIQAGGTGGGS